MGVFRMYGCFSRGRTSAPSLLRQSFGADSGLTVFSASSAQAAAIVRHGLRDLQAASQDGSFAILDGELFNAPELAVELGLPAETEPALVALSLYRRCGIQALASLNSTALVVLWDAATETLILARDRAGFAPCFWMERDGDLFFASRLMDLVQTDDRTELDPIAVDQFLAAGIVSAPRTTLAHIRKVPAAHCLVIDRSTTRLVRYFRQNALPKRKLPFDQAVNELEKLEANACRRRLAPGKTAAALLSGGIDSMLMLAVLTQTCGQKVDSFTFRYLDYDGPYNEGERAARAAAACESRYHEIPVGPQDVTEQLERMLIDHDGPMSYGVHTSIMTGVVRSGAEILYSGQGNDSLYAAPLEVLGLKLNRLPLPYRTLRAALPGIIARFHSQAGWAAGYLLQIAESGFPWRYQSHITSDELRAQLYGHPSHASSARAELLTQFHATADEFAGQPARERLAMYSHNLIAPEGSQHWTTAFARAHGLTVRCPHYDNDVVEFLYRLKRRGHKAELRTLAERLLPKDLAHAPKFGQTMPVGHWFRGPLADFLRDRLSPARLRAGALFRPEMVDQLMRQHFAGINHGWTLWCLLALTVWGEIVVRQAGRSTAAAGRLSA
jgi:asparagine synthase (glutamine-hydrolysing)